MAFTWFNVATGNAAAANGYSLHSIQNFVTKWGSVFKEACLVGAKFQFRVASDSGSNTRGTCLVSINEANNLTPTYALIANVPKLVIDLQDFTKVYEIDYKVADYTELEWLQIGSGTSGNPNFWLNFYAAIADTGTSALTNAQVQINATFAVDFRGLA